MVGRDVNKKGRPEVAELGGIASVFAFSISLSLVVGFKSLGYQPTGWEMVYLAPIGVFFIASMVGLIDDISNIRQRVKAAALLFAALPLLIVHFPLPVVRFPFGFFINFEDPYVLYIFYWLVLVPIGVTGMANAMNMSAGYNGLESGQVMVISIGILFVGMLRGSDEAALVIFTAIAGCSLGLFYFNRFPAKVFVGDIGTLGLGAAMAAGVIIGHIEFYAIIAIAPAFYELFATVYFGMLKRAPDRRAACHNPVINEDGSLSPPEGAKWYTLAYLLLSKKPMTESKLVAVILALYGLSSLAALGLSVI